MKLRLMAIHILCVSSGAEFFVSLVLLQGSFNIFLIHLQSPHRQKIKHFIQALGQDLLFWRFPLRKNTFRHSTVPQGGREGGGGQGVMKVLQCSVWAITPLSVLEGSAWKQTKKKKRKEEADSCRVSTGQGLCRQSSQKKT